MALKTVMIGIQARSTSERLPRKVHMEIDGKPLLKYVIDSARQAASYSNRHSTKNGYFVDVALLIPKDDEIKSRFRGLCPIIEGDEKDVLSRYTTLQHETNADFVVRITGDCPLVPHFVIQKITSIGMINGYDYVSNVGNERESIRTTIDGHDCEFMSKAMLKYLDENSDHLSDREHVTALARRSKPSWARYGHIIGHVDLSGIKLSVDTQEDFDRVSNIIKLLKAKEAQAIHEYGMGNIYHF